jgi:hypothetical protein
VREIARGRFPDSHWQPSPPALIGDGYVLEPQDAYCLIHAAVANDPFIWIKAGIALDIPLSERLAYFVATTNSDLIVGRTYLATGQHVGLVVMEETVFAAALSWEHQPSIVDLINRLENLLRQARDMRLELLRRFEGRPFRRDDWGHLLVGHGAHLTQQEPRARSEPTRASGSAVRPGESDKSPRSGSVPGRTTPQRGGSSGAKPLTSSQRNRQCVARDCIARGQLTKFMTCTVCGQATRPAG